MVKLKVLKPKITMDGTVFITRNEFLANIGSGMLIVLTFLPYANYVFGEWINYCRCAAVILFMMGVFVKDRNMFLKIVTLLLAGLLFNIYYYYQLWYYHVTFGSFIVQSMLCWVYSSFAIYYNRYGSGREKKYLLYLFMLILLVTSITTIFALRVDPLATRILGNGGFNSREVERNFYGMNTATWGTLYGMAFAIPMLIVWMKRTASLFCLIVICAVILCVLRAQITFAVLFTAMFLVCVFLKNIRLRKLLLIALFAVLAMLLFRPLIADMIFVVYEHMDENIFGVLKYKTFWIYQTIEQGSMYGGAEGRSQLYLESINTFLKNPLCGYRPEPNSGNYTIGLHSQVFDTMAATGLVGCFPCVMAFSYLIWKSYNGIKDHMTRLCYCVAILGLCLFMCVNPVWYAYGAFMSVFLLPALVS